MDTRLRVPVARPPAAGRAGVIGRTGIPARFAGSAERARPPSGRSALAANRSRRQPRGQRQHLALRAAGLVAQGQVRHPDRPVHRPSDRSRDDSARRRAHVLRAGAAGAGAVPSTWLRYHADRPGDALMERHGDLVAEGSRASVMSASEWRMSPGRGGPKIGATPPPAAAPIASSSSISV